MLLLLMRNLDAGLCRADLRVTIKSIPSLLSHLRAIVPSVLLFSDSIEQETHAVHTVC